MIRFTVGGVSDSRDANRKYQLQDELMSAVRHKHRASPAPLALLKLPTVLHLLYLVKKTNKHVTLTCQDACQVNHSHLKAFVDQFQRDAQQQLHHQVAHDVLHTGEAEDGE